MSRPAGAKFSHHASGAAGIRRALAVEADLSATADHNAAAIKYFTAANLSNCVETADDLSHSKLSSTIQDRRSILDWPVPEPRERTGREMICGVARGAAAKEREAITDTAMPRSIESNLQDTNPELAQERRTYPPRTRSRHCDSFL